MIFAWDVIYALDLGMRFMCGVLGRTAEFEVYIILWFHIVKIRLSRIVPTHLKHV